MKELNEPDKNIGDLAKYKPNLAFLSSMIEAKKLIDIGQYNSSLILIVGALETFLKDRLIEIINSKSHYAVGEHAIKRWSFENISQANKAYKTLINFDLRDMIMERREEAEYFYFLNKICSIRHILVHNGGIIDKKGSEDLKLDSTDIGKVIEIDKEFADKAYEAVTVLSVMIDDEFNFKFAELDLLLVENKIMNKKQLFKFITKKQYEELEFKGLDVNILNPKPRICPQCLTENTGAICSKCGYNLCCDY